MLEKDKISSKINRLRVIGKYDTNYNLLLTFYWPKLTKSYAAHIHQSMVTFMVKEER